MTGLETYLVEAYVPRTSPGGPDVAAARVRAVATQMRREGTPIRVLHSFFLPEDEVWFCLYEARSADEVAEANRRAELVLGRIQRAVGGDVSARVKRAESEQEMKWHPMKRNDPKRVSRRNEMRRLHALAGVVAALGFAAIAAGPAAADRGSYGNWHVHDGGSGVDANGLVHRGVAFFPSILPGDYSQDPAYCPDATDKLTLPNGSNGEFPIAGICMTNAYVIHLRAIPSGDPVPAGWQDTGWATAGAEVYYLLTAR